MHVDLIGPYGKYIIENHRGDAINKNNVSLTCMTMIDSSTSWSKIVKVSMYDLDEVTGGNDDYIDNSYARVIQLLNNTWLRRYPCSRKVVLDNGSDFK